MNVAPSRPPVFTPETVEGEIRRLFDAQGAAGLVIRVHGETGLGSAEATASFKELLASLKMYDCLPDGEREILVEPPTRETLVRALSVLSRPDHQRRMLDHVLTTFGRRLLDPLGLILDRSSEGSLLPRLTMLREIFMVQIRELRLTKDTEDILANDLRKVLTDEYLEMVTENEERVQRPRVGKLAQETLRLIGSTFHRALRVWPTHAERIAASLNRRMQGPVAIRESPVVIRRNITAAIEEFLWVETSTELDGALTHLFAKYRDVAPKPPEPLDRSVYGSFADACWKLIAENC